MKLRTLGYATLYAVSLIGGTAVTMAAFEGMGSEPTYYSHDGSRDVAQAHLAPSVERVVVSQAQYDTWPAAR